MILLLLGKHILLDITIRDPRRQIALESADTHAKENHIGAIHSIVPNNNYVHVVLHRIARHEFAQNRFSELTTRRPNCQ
jgi:hypothetical protein